MKNLFTTPVTYRIEKETIWGASYISKVYYSIPQALKGFKLMNLSKYGDKCIYKLIHLQGDQEIARQRINF